MMEKLEFNSFLLSLSKKLGQSDFEQLKFLLKVFVPLGRSEGLKEPFQFFAELDRKQLIAPTDLSILRSGFKDIGRQDLVQELDEKKDFFNQLFQPKSKDHQKGKFDVVCDGNDSLFGSDLGAQKVGDGKKKELCQPSPEDKKPPQLWFNLANTGDVQESTIMWRDDHLPIDILLLTAESCGFLSCFSFLDQPFKCYKREIGVVYLGYMGDASDQEKLKVALINSSVGAAAPVGSLTEVRNAVRFLRPKAVFSVGTCISLGLEKARMGDVVISSRLVTTEGFKTPASPRLGSHAQDAPYGWEAPLKHPDEWEIKVHCNGDILSQSLREKCQFVNIREQYPKAVAIETEGEDVYAAAYDASIEWVMVKGVASYFHQSQSAASEWVSFSSAMAASVVAKMLNDPVVFQEWPHYNQVGDGKKKELCQPSPEDKKPPQLWFNLANTGDVRQSTKIWRDDHLPIDILLLTAESCSFLSCFLFLDQPFKCYKKEIGIVYFGCMGDASDQEKLKVALINSSVGAAAPGGSLTVVWNAVRVLRPKAVFSVGTCISLGLEKARMGDVVISSRLVTSEGFKTPASPLLGSHAQDAPYGWEAPLKHPDEWQIKVHCNGDILSQSLREKCQFVNIREQYPKAVAIETEGEDVYAAAYDASIEWVMVKGVASYFHQSQSAASEWVSFSSAMAASVVAKMLNDPVVFQEWPHYNQESTSLSEDSSSEMAENMMFCEWFQEEKVTPPEIHLRGPRALEAYYKALEEGKTRVRRIPVMLVGQARSGKTSLKKSLKGIPFNPNEDSTVGIDVDPSYFKVTTETWKIGEEDQATNKEAKSYFEFNLGRQVLKNLKPDENLPPTDTEAPSVSERNDGTEDLPSRGLGRPDAPSIRSSEMAESASFSEDSSSEMTDIWQCKLCTCAIGHLPMILHKDTI
ncbi:uncharacterized protein LOC114951256 [Acropora millepora]|uniref:uncharacterized protein LOC114951256 n=1 Tax=Acropora millepora TaxID=45264 RepID=UPI001CF2DAF1|nr:uncharacterized protein LOC114951256 [Acropora millepora]